MREVDFLIVGAGPTGIGAAHRLSQLNSSWLMIEAEPAPGGMAKSVTDGHGFTWDLGGHVLHSHFPIFDQALADAGVQFTYPQRNGWIWMDGQLRPTPIQQHLDALPTDTNPDAPATNLREYYLNQFGSKLTEEFFEPFQWKMWPEPLENIGHEWTSVRNGSTERNVPSLSLTRPPATQQRFPYPIGGTGKLWETVLAAADPGGSHVEYGTRLVAIQNGWHAAHILSGLGVRGDVIERIKYKHLITTAPLSGLPLRQIDDELRLALTKQLVASGAYLVGVGFNGHPPEALADKSWLYNPDLGPNKHADMSWHRATMLSNYYQGNAGEGRWNVLFEVGLGERQLDKTKALEYVFESLTKLGADTSKAVTVWERELEFGYPIPTLGRDETLHAINDKLVSQGIYSRGRFGGWRYESCNQDYSFMQGYDAVDAALFGLPEHAYWKPEAFS